MPFFKFKYATEGIGRAYPQSESFGQSVDYRHPESIRSLRLKSTSTFHLHTIKLVKSAKITDVISSVANKVFGTIVSDRFVEILSEYRCSDLDIHSLKLEKDSNFSYGYNYIKFNQDSFNSVDNKKSQFQLEIKNDVFEFANMSNDEFQFYFRDGKLKEGRYEGKLYNFTNYTIGEIVLLDNFNYDFFFMRNVPVPRPGIILSERLKNRLEYEEISGLLFEELPKLIHPNYSEVYSKLS